MTTPITFVPHPRLAYTELYNQLQEMNKRNLEVYQQANVAINTTRYENYTEKQRLERNLEYSKHIEQLNLYTHLDRVRAYQDYKYAYWVGTLVDQYI